MNALSIRWSSIIGLNACLLAALIASKCLADVASTETILKTAASGAGKERYTAIDDLGERREDAAEVVPALEKMLSDTDVQVRWRSTRALGDYDELAKGAAPALRKLLTDPDPIVQYHAAVALGKIEDKSNETVDALVKTATSKDGRVARAAIAALRNLKPGPQHIVKALSDVLESNDKAVMLYALEAIVERGGEATPLLIEALQDPKTTYLACTAIAQIGPPAKGTVPALTEVIGSTKHSKLLIQALLAIAAIGPDAATASPKIVPLLDFATDTTVPVAAAYALGSIGAKDAEAALKKAAQKDNAFLQMTATWAIAKLHPGDEATTKAAVMKLVQGLKDSDRMIRMAAAKGLQSLQAPPEMVAPQLVPLINDKDPEVQNNVLDAIAGLGESVVPRVNHALENPEYRGAAVLVVKKLGPKAAGAVDALMKAAEQGDAQFRTDVQMALGAIGPGAAAATPMLIKSLSSSDMGERESALYALRQAGPKAEAAVPALAEKLKAGDTFESHAASWALARIAPNNPRVAAQVIAMSTKGLTNASEQVRAESADSLAELGAAAKPAVPALQKAAKEDDSESVRDTAAAALKRIGG